MVLFIFDFYNCLPIVLVFEKSFSNFYVIENGIESINLWILWEIR